VKVEDDQLLLHEATANTDQMLEQNMPLGVVSQANVASYTASQRRPRKRMHDGNMVTAICFIVVLPVVNISK